MFPTLTELFAYLFHVQVNIPVQTFGFFVALAFLIPCFVFKAEFKRKETDGLIFPFTEKQIVGAPASVLEIALNALLGFVLGFKVLAAIINYRVFAVDPLRFVCSTSGNLIAGIAGAAAFAIWVYVDARKAQLPESVATEKVIHPYQLTGYLVFVLGFFGFIGAKLFDVVEHFDLFLMHPAATFFSSGGFNFYGGLVFGSLTYLYILHKKGMKLIHLADIGSPGMMLAYTIGRLGCHLSGDGDWGIVNMYPQPHWLQWLPGWMWSFRFPHNVINAGQPMPGCVGNYCMQLVEGVYPTSFYEFVICLTLFLLMWGFRRKMKIPGLMFCLYLILNGTERLLIEMIRVTDRHLFLGLRFTQAQFIAVLFIAGGLSGLIYILTKPCKATIN